jgi:hypothetical protein
MCLKGGKYENMKFECVTSRYGNFTKGKIYESYMEFVNSKGEIMDAKILDDEFDSYYALDSGKVDPIFRRIDLQHGGVCYGSR